MRQEPPPGPSPRPPAGPRRLALKHLLVVLGLAATAYAAALLLAGGDAPRLALSRLWSATGLQAALLCLASYGLRGLRWRGWMALHGRHFGFLQGLRLYLAGYAFTPTPGNVGEAMRGLMLARQPLGARQSLGIFGAERLADLLCLLLLCLPAAAWAWQRGWLQWATVWSTGLGLAGLLVAALALAGAAWAWARRAALARRLAWLQEAGNCLRHRPWLWLGVTLAAWTAQGLAVWLVCRDARLDIGFMTATGLYAVAMVAGALSALPAGLGGTEAVLAGLLVAGGAGAGVALGITVLVRLLTLWLAVAIGLAALIYSAAIVRDIDLS